MYRIKSLRENFLVSILVDVYITLLLNRVFLSMKLQQKITWQKWFSDSNSFKPVNSSVTFADVVKNNVFMSKKGKNTPLVAVQGGANNASLLNWSKRCQVKHRWPISQWKEKTGWLKTSV